MTARVLVIGAGLTGATVAWSLGRQGFDVDVVEQAPSWGGQLRTADAAGILFEPYGAHIFHTQDTEVWEIATSLTSMLPYRHRVMTEVDGQTLSWPPQLPELSRLRSWPSIERELARLPAVPRNTNFEVWCIDVMGPTLYGLFIEPYTRKQWGMEPSELSSQWAPKRLELRTDGYTDLFRDPYQGWPAGGYLTIIDGLLRDTKVTFGVTVDAESVGQLSQGYAATIVTTALDDFFAHRDGALPWRGVSLISRYHPGLDHILPCGVVNHPGLDRSYTRRIETKWMSMQTEPGTVVSEEYPGAPARHYPIDDVNGQNRDLARHYARTLTAEFGPHFRAAGRLATYSYIDMHQAMRQGLNAASDVAQMIESG